MFQNCFAFLVDARLLKLGVFCPGLLKNRNVRVAVALVFLEGRVIGGVTGWENLGDRASETIVWVCLAFSILAADLVLQGQKSAVNVFERLTGLKKKLRPPPLPD